MGKRLAESLPSVRRLYDRAAEVLGYDLAKLCFEGPAEELDSTVVSQPALFVTSLVALESLRAESPDVVLSCEAAAGLSLGEYTALWAAGALSFEDGVRLTRRRGELMQAAAEANPSTMVSIMGQDEGQVKNICEAASALGIISPANFNCPGQIVVSGTKGACAKALALAEEAGGRAVELKVAGAFHSQLMASAAAGLARELDAITLSDLRMPVVANVTANYYASSAEIRPMLVRQLTGSILWQKSMERLLADGFDTFYEIGPGRVLRGLMKKIARGAAVTGVNGAAETGAC